MKIYIAGKITGLDYETAYDLFEVAENVIFKYGHVPLNPMTLVDQSEGREYFEYLLEAVKIMLFESEAVYMLPNWRQSDGAKVEHFMAEVFKRPIFYAASDLPEVSR